MTLSPLQQLAFRRLCSCPHTPTSTHISRRWLASSRVLHSQHWTPGAGAYGSSEILRRKHQRFDRDPEKKDVEHASYKRRMRWATFGIAACAVGLVATSYFVPKGKRITQNDGPPSIAGLPDTSVNPDVKKIPTGTSTIPTFPKLIYLSDTAASEESANLNKGEQEYQLVGLGIRTVFYLEVYVVGLYVEVSDVAKLQERLIRAVDPIATTLVAGEKTKLKELLLDPVKGQEIWNEVLKEGGIRMAMRIVPTRNTDFVHLRDGWVRGITAKTQFFNSQNDQSFSDESFGSSLNDFKTVLGGGFRKKVPWGETIVLLRDGKGELSSWYEDNKGNKVNLGSVRDERISRLLWLIYLGGKQVSSEPFRKNVIDGVIGFVERPVGTVATQVV